MEPIGGEDPEAQYEYCCNMHIIRAVKVVALIGLVVNPIWSIYWVLSSPVTPYDFALVSICLYALILVGLRKENPRLLIPFLIFNGITIIARTIYCVVILFTMSSEWFWEHWRKEHPGQDPNPEKVALVLHLVFNVLKVLMNVWFEHIIYRGFLYMQSRAENQPLLVAQPVPHPAGNYPRPTGPPPPPANYQEPQPNAVPPPPMAPPPAYGQIVVEQGAYEQV